MHLDTSLDSLQRVALKAGYLLSSPTADMYGGYECSIEHLASGQVFTAMNCSSASNAANQAYAAAQESMATPYALYATPHSAEYA
jgi:hypothetical protein